MTSTVTTSNLFNGTSGIYGAIGDGVSPGHSLYVLGDGSTVEINVVNPDSAQVQVEVARQGTNIWEPIGEIITASRIYFALWENGFQYRVRQLTASPNGVQLFVINNANPSLPAVSSGFGDNVNTLITLDRINTLLPLP